LTMSCLLAKDRLCVKHDIVKLLNLYSKRSTLLVLLAGILQDAEGRQCRRHTGDCGFYVCVQLHQ
jgi:hypothetical protein